jgi:DNA-binding LacI/PurR family transcriptional regulator
MTVAGGRPMPAPTLEQVAAHAGVGRGTVSRVINGSPQVSQKAREAVERAISELGYVPNRAARSLASRRTDSIALVVSEAESRVFSEPFFAGIIRGVSAALAETDMQLLLILAQTPEERDRLRRYLTGQRVDGVLLISLHGEDPLPSSLESMGIPAVLCGRPAAAAPDAESLSYVDADNAGGAQHAVRFLLEQGRRRIATIAGPLDMAVGQARLRGYQDELAAAGHDPEGLVTHGDFSESSGLRAMRRLLRHHPDIDAVFAASDLMAAGAMQALKEIGRRIPEDVAVIGFDDSTVARHTEPPLTTVRQPIETMGREMTRLLLSRINDGSGDPRKIIVKTRLVTRESA